MKNKDDFHHCVEGIMRRLPLKFRGRTGLLTAFSIANPTARFGD
jgi:hypothetical protein